MNSPEFIFGFGLTVRTGTNYLGRLLSAHPNVGTIPGEVTYGEFPFLRKEFAGSIQNSITYFNTSFDLYNRKEDSKYTIEKKDILSKFSNFFLEYLSNKFQPEGTHTFVKDPSIELLNEFSLWFPGSKAVVIVRDGRDHLCSFLRATQSKRKGRSLSTKIKRFFNYYSGRGFIQHTINWKRKVIRLQSYLDAMDSTDRECVMVVKYEELYQKREVKEQVFSFFNLEVNDEVLKKIEDLDVVGSSFLSASGGENTSKTQWKPILKSESFSPVGRWKSWGVFKRLVFKTIANQQLNSLGYNW